jgi:hypothetical protein
MRPYPHRGAGRSSSWLYLDLLIQAHSGATQENLDLLIIQEVYREVNIREQTSTFKAGRLLILEALISSAITAGDYLASRFAQTYGFTQADKA